jgi:hypothetical protein
VFDPPGEKRSVRVLPIGVEGIMYQSASIARKSSGDFTIVLTFALLGLALSLLLIGKASLIDPEYMAALLLSF